MASISGVGPKIIMRVRIPPTAHRAAVSSLLHATLALHVALLGPSQSLAALDLFAPPTWVTTENGVELQRMSDAVSTPGHTQNVKRDSARDRDRMRDVSLSCAHYPAHRTRN